MFLGHFNDDGLSKEEMKKTGQAIQLQIPAGSVSDPHKKNADPDPCHSNDISYLETLKIFFNGNEQDVQKDLNI